MSLVASKMPTKDKCFFAYYLLLGIFTSVFKDSKSLRSHKTVEIKVFLIYLLVDGRIRISNVQIVTDHDPGGPQTYGSYGSGARPVVSK